LPAKAENSKRVVVRHEVRDGVQRMIISGRQRPGSKLVQQKLAKQFGVAQGVIREALLELQVCGLVETIDNRGMYVSRIDKDKLLEAFEVREVHEGLAARRCCTRVTRADLAELTRIVDEIYRFARESKPEQMSALDRQLHARITQLAGNRMLTRLADNYIVLGKVMRARRDPKAVHAEHLAILGAIEAGDEAEAERLMRQHIRAGREAVEKIIGRGEMPEWVV
jgi:DNA-binding GntR family transcriptional regulator